MFQSLAKFGVTSWSVEFNHNYLQTGHWNLSSFRLQSSGFSTPRTFVNFYSRFDGSSCPNIRSGSKTLSSIRLYSVVTHTSTIQLFITAKTSNLIHFILFSPNVDLHPTTNRKLCLSSRGAYVSFKNAFTLCVQSCEVNRHQTKKLCRYYERL
jgi:hypothetical protein